MKLAVKITLVSILVVCLVIAIMMVVSISTSRQGLVGQIGQAELELARTLIGEIDFVLYVALQDIKSIAEDEEFESAVSGYGDLDESKDKLAELLFLTGPWYGLELFDEKGNYLVDAGGIGYGEHSDNLIMEEQIAYEFVVTNGRAYVSDLVLDGDVPTMIFAAPIHDETAAGHPLRGVVMGNFAWPVIEDILGDVGLRDAFLFNSKGFIIASNSGERGDILRQTDLGFHEYHQQVGDSFDVSISSVGGFEVVRGHVGQQGHLAYEGDNWVLLLESPTKEAFVSVRKTTRNLLLAGMLLLISIILVAFYFARSIAKPIVVLKQSADKISSGNLSEKIDFKGDDELTELAESFDNMRYSLNSIIKEYENIKGKEELSAKLRESDSKFKALFDESPDGILLFDKKTKKMVDFNVQMHTGLGYTRKEFEKLKISDIGSREDIMGVKSNVVKQNVNSGGVVETKYKRKDGALMDVLVTSKSIELGGKDFVMSIVRDISEEKIAERRYQFIFENTSDALIVVDLETTKIIDFNHSTQRMLGYSADVLFKMTMSDLYPTDKKVEMSKLFTQLISGSRKRITELEFLRKDGVRVLVNGNVAKVSLGDKEVVLGSFRLVVDGGVNGVN